MFVQCLLIVYITIFYSNTLELTHEEVYLIENGPLGLILIKKNDSHVDWVRVPEVNYRRWIFALKVWRTVRLSCMSFFLLILVVLYYFSVRLFLVYFV